MTLTPDTRHPTPDTRHPTPVSRSSLRTWLAARQPPPPATLAAELSELVDASPDSMFVGESVGAAMAGLAVFALNSQLSTLDSSQPSTPDCALQLLAADAFVTYAFEVASEEGTDVAGLANQLLAQLRA